MIEKLARAIHDIIENDDDGGGGAYLRAARACLEALREPSEAMLVAGADHNDWLYSDEIKPIWQAMIDVALERKAA